MRVGGGKNPLVLLILLLFGAIIGSILGDLLSAAWPLLKEGPSIGLKPPVTLDLHVFEVTFGFSFKVNLASALGIILAYLFYRRF